ncbi:hypothetical protein ACFWG5_11825 [Streptomyces hydrogenans]|uniref:hypothetical protein n=1 Tax=Streptomyces hydrogenans TaxID=1873719 RepID=UPI00366164DF
MLADLSSAEWHDRWKRMVDVSQREQRRGAHIADIVTVDGCVVEIQHASMSPTKIEGRELDHGHMVWVWDARQAFSSGQLQVTCLNGAVVSFRWRNHRRNLRSCRRTQFLDLGRLTPDGPAVVLRIEQFNEDGTGLGSLISHHSMRLWMTCGIKYRPLTEVPEIPQQRAKAVA